jgi:LacI family repressor for deo operon, udp, cdd, tsx, nupC, and nupG
MQSKTATIEDVARLAGVSIATVSRALHHPAKVAEATRKKVLAAIDSTGFTANAMAQSLRLKSTRMILVIVPDIGNTFFASILRGLEAVAQQRGYGLLIGNSENDPAIEETYVSYLRSGKVDGLVLLSGRLPWPAGSIPANPPPMISVCEEIEMPGLPFIGIDNMAAARLATEHLIAAGHRRIAYVAGPARNILTRQRQEGYAAALAAAGIPLDPALLLPGDFSIESGVQAAADIAGMKEPPTAFFCANDEMAIGVIMELTRRGLKVPEDVAVMGFDDIQFSSCTNPPLTTVRQPRREIGEEAMGVLLDLIETGTPPSLHRVLPVELIVRGSTGTPASAR